MLGDQLGVYVNSEKMSAIVERPKVGVPLKMTGRFNQAEFCSNSKNDRPSRHYSFCQAEDKGWTPKRRYSEKFTASSAAHGWRKKFARFTNRGNQGKIVLPTKFLLGGNIRDPLNLNSLCDEEINRSLNEFTPVSSPYPVPMHKLEVPILFPANARDPLNLEGSDENDRLLTVSPMKNSKPRKRRHSHKKLNKAVDKNDIQENGTVESGLMKPLSIEIDPMVVDVHHSGPLSRDSKNAGDSNAKKILDKIVSPVIPQISPKWKRRRTLSESRQEVGDLGPKVSQAGDSERPVKSEKAVAARLKSKRNSMNLSGFKGKNARFIQGNYSTYHGYRTPVIEDPRLKMFPKDLCHGKDVLDIGCNVGHVTLGVAQNFMPRKIVGIDVDGKLVEAAKKNIRHYLSDDMEGGFPVSLKIMRGPLASHPLLGVANEHCVGKFPHNVTFQKGNYHLETNDEVNSQQPGYDVILALGITKWIHLNYGDAGLKRCFLRMYRQLRPGGTLILEAQKWGSYRKKKKLTEHTYQVYKSIQFRPDQFREFLTSKEIGFSSCRFLGIPSTKSKGSCSTVHIFTKDDDSIPFSLPSARLPTRFSYLERPEPVAAWPDSMDSHSSLGWGTPQFEFGSSQVTPCSTCDNTSSQACASQSGTPWTERTCSSVEGLPTRDLVTFVGGCLTDEVSGDGAVEREMENSDGIEKVPPSVKDFDERNGH